MVDVDARHVEDALGLVWRLLPQDSFERSYVDAGRAALDRLLAVLKEQADRIERLQREATETVARSGDEASHQAAIVSDVRDIVRRWALRGSNAEDTLYAIAYGVGYYLASPASTQATAKRSLPAPVSSASEASRLLTERDAERLQARISALAEKAPKHTAWTIAETGLPLLREADNAIDALRAALVARDAELAEARAERERVVNALPFGDVCGTCGGAAEGNPVGPCVNCGRTGTEPDLAASVEEQLRYLERQRDAERAGAEALEAEVTQLRAALEAASKYLAELHHRGIVNEPLRCHVDGLLAGVVPPEQAPTEQT